ncbi:MAG: GntR family transcriptional regulator [Hyphomicrobiales bacterium]
MSTISFADAIEPPAGADRASWLAERLGQAIIDGFLKPGEKLNEPRLSRRFGVSRAPLREAIGRLEGRRLVVRKPHQGARVASLDPAEFIQLFHVREGLEGIAARLAAVRIHESELGALDSICQAQQSNGLAEKFSLDLDMSFHHFIARASGSPLLSSILCEEFYIFYKIMRRRYRMLPQRQREAVSQHCAIRDSLRARDGELAEFLMRHHVKGAREAFELAVKSGEADEDRHAGGAAE